MEKVRITKWEWVRTFAHLMETTIRAPTKCLNLLQSLLVEAGKASMDIFLTVSQVAKIYSTI